MFSRAATLMCALLLVGCKNAPNQMSLYAPFGPSIVPPPSLTRGNAAPYYNEPSDKTGPNANPPPATANAGNKDLSHYDPYRGILIPGNYTPPPVLARSTETWGTGATDLAAERPRERASNEEPIRIVESTSSPSSAIASQSASSRSGVKFNASPPSGVVKPGEALMAATAKPKTVNAIEVARLPKTTAPITTPASPPAFNPTAAPLINPTVTPPGLLPLPSSSTPATPAPGGNRVSLWNDPRDGSRVMPAAHLEESSSADADAGAWRVKR